MSTQPETDQMDAFSPSAKKKKKGRNIILFILLLAVAGGGYYWQMDTAVVEADAPLIVNVEMGNIENTIAAVGSLQPYNVVDVGAQVSGQLQKLFVDVGDLVEEGQLLAEIDARVQENRVAASRANIEAQEAQIDARNASLRLAESNADRQERLREDNATSQLDYDNAINNLVSAQASLIQLEKQIIQSLASLASDETQLEFTKIYAPTAGTIVSIEMNEGRTLNASQQAPTILRIADLSVMTVETEISEADIGNLEKGVDVYFTTLGGGNRRWYSSLRQILPTPKIDNNVVLYTGLFDIDNGDSSLYSEMTAQVFFVTSSANNVVMVPVGALTYKNAGGFPGRQPGDAGAAGASGGSFPAGMGNRGGMPPGAAAGGFGRPPAAGPNESGTRLATVEVVLDDGSMEARDVVVGITSRISAEIISGLSIGDKVVAGIIQANAPVASGDDNGGFRGPPGGFF